MNNDKKKTLPFISVIVVSFNSEKYISHCIESILQSDYPNFEIIVVDNNSTDNSVFEIKKYQNKIKLILNKSNVGFAVGNNIGIKKSKGEILVLINPDAYVKKDSISKLVEPILDDEKVIISGSKILYPESNIIQSAGGIIQKNGLTNHFGYKEVDNAQQDFQKEVDYVTGAAMAIKRKLFELTGLFDPCYYPAYYEEAEKCTQARKLNFKVIYAPESTVYHHESTTLVALSRPFLKTFHKSRFKFIYRNFGAKDYFSKFIPSELQWFLKHCPQNEKNLVMVSHLQAIFSERVLFKKRSPKLLLF